MLVGIGETDTKKDIDYLLVMAHMLNSYYKYIYIYMMSCLTFFGKFTQSKQNP